MEAIHRNGLAATKFEDHLRSVARKNQKLVRANESKELFRELVRPLKVKKEITAILKSITSGLVPAADLSFSKPVLYIGDCSSLSAFKKSYMLTMG